MIEPAAFFSFLQQNDIDFYTGVPDSLLKDVCAYITDYSSNEKNIVAANEGIAVAIACGYHLATGETPVVYMQNSGIGNATNPLLSLADEEVYKLPLLLLVGWRGEPGIKDEPQHIKQGEVTIALFEAMKIPHIILDTEWEKAEKQMNTLLTLIKEKNAPHAVIIRKDTFATYKLQKQTENIYPLSRERALQIVVDSLGTKDIVLSTTGKLSRELFEYRKSAGQTHEKDFLTVGSMGHSCSIALGIALVKKNCNVYCLDGDGALIMHTGALANIGHLSPANYKHIVFNNGAHESVGKQPTVAYQIELPQIALSCDYKAVFRVTQISDLKKVLKTFRDEQGPGLLEIKVNLASRDDLGRPTRTTHENKEDFMKFLEI